MPENIESSSFVVTEDDYVSYLIRTEIENIPVGLTNALKSSHLLFLGYGLRDWNMRAVLQRLWKDRRKAVGFAIQHRPKELDRKMWSKHNIEIFDLSLEQFVPTLSAALQELQHRAAE